MVDEATTSVLVGAVDDEKAVLELARLADSNNQIEQLEKHLLTVDQVQHDVRHTFSPGIYVRELHIPKGCFVIGHMHKTQHINMLIKGKMTVIVNGETVEVSAPFIINSLPGSRKMGYAHEDSVWVNVHATNETNLDKLEESLIEKSETFKQHKLNSRKEDVLLEIPTTP